MLQWLTTSPSDMGKPEIRQKFEERPIAVVMVWPPGQQMNRVAFATLWRP